MKLFELYATLELDTTGFYTDINKAEESVKGLGESLTGVNSASKNNGLYKWGTLAKNAVAFLGGTELARWFTNFSKESINLASNLEEVQNVVDTVFGMDGSRKLELWAENMKYTAGMGELAAKQYASTFGTVFATAGLDPDEIYEMSTAMTQLVGDVASFQGLSHQEVFGKFMSMFAGESEPLRRIGIDTRASMMEKYADALGLSWKELEDAERMRLYYSYAFEKTGFQQGDFEKTQGSYANQMRLLEENFADLSADFGTWLLQAVTPAVALVNKMFEEQKYIGKQLLQGDMAEQTRLQELQNMRRENAAAIATISQYYGRDDLTSSEQIAYVNAMQTLIDSHPAYAEMIDRETMSIEGGVEALKEQQKLLESDIALEAKRENLAQKQLALSDAQLKKDEADADLFIAQADAAATRENALDTIRRAWGSVSDVSFEDYFASTNALFGNAANIDFFDPSNKTWQTILATTQQQLNSNAELADPEDYQQWADLYSEVSNAAEAVTAADAALPSFQQAAETAGIELKLAEENVSIAQKSFDRLAESTIDSGNAQTLFTSQLQGVEQGAWDAAAAIAAYNAAVNGATVDDASPKASGMGYVPYDGYRAELHRGEQILTRQQAEQYRSGGSKTTGINTGELKQVIAAALNEWLSPVGEDQIVGVVNRGIGQSMRGRR